MNSVARFLLRTKLYWGLLVIFGTGILISPVNSRGVNIFLSPGNLSDVLRQVSNNGIVAVGMTLVILTAGIDLSVGSVMALGSVLCAMLLTKAGWTNASLMTVPVMTAGLFLVIGLTIQALMRLSSSSPTRRFSREAYGGQGLDQRKRAMGQAWVAWVAAAVVAGLVAWWAAAQVPGKFGVPGVLIAVPLVGLAVGTLNGIIIAKGRLQPFIVTLAMMVGILGVARLVAGQDTSVYPVYTGTNATEDFDLLRALIWGLLPVPGLFFLAAVIVFHLVLTRTTFGRYVATIGGNEQATRLSGINTDRIKIAVYALSGMLACLAGVLYTAQYRQGKPDAGAGMELDAIAAVVIGGTSLMGGKGSVVGTLVGVLIFGFLGNILQLRNIDGNTQLVLKGLIILAAVLLQEGNLRLWLHSATIGFRRRPSEAANPAQQAGD